MNIIQAYLFVAVHYVVRTNNVLTTTHRNQMQNYPLNFKPGQSLQHHEGKKREKQFYMHVK